MRPPLPDETDWARGSDQWREAFNEFSRWFQSELDKTDGSDEAIAALCAREHIRLLRGES